MQYLKSLVAGAVLAVAAVGPALAVDVRQVTEIAAPPARVWAKVGDWCAIKDWHPAISNCTSETKGFRTLTLKDGGRIVEKLTKTGKFSYSYDIIDSPLPVRNYSATLTAKPDSNGNTDLVWSAKFDAKDKTEAEAQAVIKGIFEAGLTNIKSNVKFDAAPVAAADAKALKEAERAKAREERQKKIDAMKAAAVEKYNAAKLAAAERYAKAKAYTAEKAKQAYDAAKASYEKLKTMATNAAKPKTDEVKPKAP
ncbi:MAG: SRPBCC family protein [Hyphomicrobium aestuarii]|nr:SRPBCC family protein [Hyphomicrobium aestuarii]